MKKILPLFLLFISCAFNLKEYPKKNIKKCEKECAPYEIFRDNSFTSEATDSLWLIYKNRKTLYWAPANKQNKKSSSTF